MFKLIYCVGTDIENDEVREAGSPFPDSLAKEYEEARLKLETFIYFLEMFLIVEDCQKDFLDFRITEDRFFWKANKYAMSFLNAAYCYLMFLNRFKKEELRQDQEEYFANNKWYSLLYKYRNQVIHQSTLLGDYDRNGRARINIDKMLLNQKNAYYKTKKAKEKRDTDYEELNKLCEELKGYFTFYEGERYLRMDLLAEKAMEGLQEVHDKAIDILIESDIKQAFFWSINHIYKENDVYKCTAWIGEKDAELDPNSIIEQFFNQSCLILGKDSRHFCKIRKLFRESGYTFFYQNQPVVEIAD